MVPAGIFCCDPHHLALPGFFWVPVFSFLQRGGCSHWALGFLGVKAGEGQLPSVHPAVPRTCSSKVLRWTQLWRVGHAELLSAHGCWCSYRASAPFHVEDFLGLATVLGFFRSSDLSFYHQPSKALVSRWTKIPGNTAHLLDHRLVRTLVMAERFERCRSRA